MTDIAARAIRSDTSGVLRRARDGEKITITMRGRAAARLVPAGRPTALEELVASGRVTPAVHAKEPSLVPVLAAGTVSDLIDQRR